MAQYASRASVELYTLLYFKGKIVVQEGYITRIKNNGFCALIPKYLAGFMCLVLISVIRYGMEGIIYVKDKDGKGDFQYDEKNNTLTSGKFSLKLFDKVTVEISVDENKQQVKLLCLSPAIHTSSGEPTLEVKRATRDTNSSTQKKQKNALEDMDE